MAECTCTISIHAPPRGATRPHQRNKAHSRNFNSRPSARGDTMLKAEFLRARIISIHAPPRGATCSIGICLINKLFQFTPLREGRHVRTFVFVAGNISIHAPPRGATRLSVMLATMYNFISIHAPPRGATTISRRLWITPRFQFTPLREGRPDQQGDAGETCYFNSRPSARGDRQPCGIQTHCPFQFTPLREGRHALVHGVCWGYWISIHAPPRGAT